MTPERSLTHKKERLAREGRQVEDVELGKRSNGLMDMDVRMPRVHGCIGAATSRATQRF